MRYATPLGRAWCMVHGESPTALTVDIGLGTSPDHGPVGHSGVSQASLTHLLLPSRLTPGLALFPLARPAVPLCLVSSCSLSRRSIWFVLAGSCF